MSMWKYDVHLRYPGEDPCKGFIDQLCNAFNQNGIRALRDDRELQSYTYPIYRVYEKSMYSIVFVHVKKTRNSYSQFMDILEGAVDYKLMVIVYNSKPSVTEYQTGEALAINEAAYGAEIHSMVAVTIDGCHSIDTTNGYQSFIDEIIEGLHRMIYEKSAGRKGFALTSFLERRLSIFWDIKSSPFPTNVIPEDIAKKIKAFVKPETNNNWEAVDIYAYGHSSAEQKAKLLSIGHSLAEQNVKLHNSDVTLIHTPHGRKDTTYFALLVDMFKRSHTCPPPSSIMLITGNISYANMLHALGLLGHKTMLVTSSEVGVSVPLINASVYTCSDVAKGTSSSQVQIKELPDDNNNCPGFILVKRQDLVATSSSQFEELSMRCEEFETIYTFDQYFLIFWDLENCPIPREVPAKDVDLNIWTFITGKIDYRICRRQIICAYADLKRIHGEVRESLEKNRYVKLINTPHVKKDAADEAMMIDLFMYSKLVDPPCSIMVITGDVDFARTLHAIDGIGHDIYLAVPSWESVSESLTSAAKGCWSWFEVANGIDLTGLRGQLVTLLKSNGGQLHLGSLDAEYQKMFNKPLLLSEYKADKLVNLLKQMGDVISVEDLNRETLVKLKGDKPRSSRKMIRK